MIEITYNLSKFLSSHSPTQNMVAAPFSPLGSLSVFDSYDETPHIGTRFPNNSVQLSRILAAPNSDELLKDLATLVSHRGVVFFTDQDIDIEKQKELGSRLGELAGKPATSKLHVHPISEQTPELTADVSVISSEGCVRFLSPLYRRFNMVTCTAVFHELTTIQLPGRAMAGTPISPLSRSPVITL